jgi:6-phosphofructokinase 1
MRACNALYAQAGGVTAVINATAAAVIRAWRARGEAVGALYAASGGMPGVLREDLIDTTAESDATLAALRHTPGGIFGSARFRLGEPEQDRATWTRIASVLRAHDIGILFYNGGNGSAVTTLQLAGLEQVCGHRLACVHIPKTIDNDMAGTDASPGFGSAAKYLAVSLREAAADVASMAGTSTRVFILEAMGRHAGWMVAAMGLVANDRQQPPHLLLFAERPFDAEDFLARVSTTVARQGYCVVGVSEGLRTADGAFVSALEAAGAGGEAQLGGVAPRLAALVRDRLGLKCHWATADYLQRSARHIASAVDLAQAEAVGTAAVDFALAGRTGVMPGILRDCNAPYRWRIEAVALHEIAGREKRLPAEFISPDGHHISAAARDYLLPLIQGEAPQRFEDGLPVHAAPALVSVPRRLPPWQATGPS